MKMAMWKKKNSTAATTTENKTCHHDYQPYNCYDDDYANDDYDANDRNGNVYAEHAKNNDNYKKME